MKTYIITNIEYDPYGPGLYQIHSVWVDKKKADAEMSRLNRYRGYWNDYELEEYEVQE